MADLKIDRIRNADATTPADEIRAVLKDVETALTTSEGKVSAAVPLAAGATPTKAEFDALINALKAAGLMEAS